jgi:hypothetical protein
MHNSKIYSILKHFNKYEQNRLRKYITSPYFNKNQLLIQLFELFIEHINNEKSTEFEKENIWKNIQADKKYDDVRFRKLCSDLLKLVESFLAQQVYEENPLHQATYLIEAVSKGKMEKLYNGAMGTARRLSKQQFDRNSNYYYYQYEIEKNYNRLKERQFRRIVRKNVEEIANNLDYFYLAEKLKYYCSVLSQQYVVSHTYELLFIDEIINHIKKYKFDEIPPIAIYYQIYLTLVEIENEEHYFKLKDLLKKYGLVFPLDEAQGIYEHALNYCVKHINKGSHRFLVEYFQLYEDLLDKEIIYTDEELAPPNFRNIVVAALRLGKYQWTEKFIHKYKARLPDSFRESTVTFNLARLYFYQKTFNKVIELLREVEYEEATDNLFAKSLLLQAFYEMDETEPMYSLMDSFRTYLNRHKEIPQQKRKNYINLIRVLKKLTNITPGDKSNIEKIKKELDKMEGIAASKTWLQEKIAELE